MIRSAAVALLFAATPAVAQSPDEMRARTAEIARRYIAEWSADAGSAVASVPYIYGPSVRFYGRRYSQADLMAEKRRVARQWPVRRYAHRPGTMQVACNDGARRCVASSVLDFQVANPARGTGRRGSAHFDLGVSFAGPQPRILFEGGSIGRGGRRV